jgi:hypothetical protein
VGDLEEGIKKGKEGCQKMARAFGHPRRQLATTADRLTLFRIEMKGEFVEMGRLGSGQWKKAINGDLFLRICGFVEWEEWDKMFC